MESKLRLRALIGAYLFCLLPVLFYLGDKGLAQIQPGLRDYSKMNHRVYVDSLRAGNHDESGMNEYYFQLTLFALRNTKEDLPKEIKERPSEAEEPKVFGELQVKVLTVWRPEGEAKEGVFLDISGDELRQIVSKAMRKFEVKESEIALMATLGLFEKNKKFIYFGEDTKVAEAKYFPVPPTEYQAPSRTNLKLILEDEFGTEVDVKVLYENPRAGKANIAIKSEKESVPASAQKVEASEEK